MQAYKFSGFLALLAVTVSGQVNSNSFISGNEYLDFQGQYWVQWNISLEENTIYFEVKAETTGYVGFGISPSGGMTGADIFIAGVNPDGTSYSSDRHATQNGMPIVDSEQNWFLTSAEESGNHTTLQFYRLLNTCDGDDMEISDATMRIIWSMGQSDTISYHGAENRGTKSVNLFLYGKEEFQPDKYNHFDITVDLEMPRQHTAYWCTIHRAPLFTQKQHVVAFEPVLDNLDAERHTHHFIFYRCQAPEGVNPEEFFEPWVGHSGDHCFTPGNASFPFLAYCSLSINYIWSKGGKRLVFPSDLGLPMPATLGEREYYAMEIHYDNPEVLQKKFLTGGRMYYTDTLRKEEVGLLLLNQQVQIQLAVPPQATNFIVNGHCSSECTAQWVPPEGVTIFNNLFHAHLAGRKMKLRHFRGNQELPWVDQDEYYDFDFQQNKPLTRPRKLERGDQLTVECTYDTMHVEGGRAVVGGMGTKEEMCESTFYYYPRQNVTFCNSAQNLDEHFKLLGVTNYTRHDSSLPGGIPEYQINSPEHLKGEYLDSLSYKVNWTQEYRNLFQYEKRYGIQRGGCFGKDLAYFGDVRYPENLVEYVPPNNCPNKAAKNLKY